MFYDTGQSWGYRHQWTMAHSFFVTMSGFVIDADDGEEYIPDSPRMTLTAEGCLAAEEAELVLPDISCLVDQGPQ